MNNDLYVSDLLSVQRVTYDGSATVFNGVPDWVYEGKKRHYLNEQILNG